MRKNPWIYYGKKLLIFVVSIFLLSVIVFYIARLAPGDPLVSYYGDRAEKMTAGERAWAEEKLGLHESITVQYGKWLGRAVRGDFGISYKYKMDVLEVIEGRVGNTLLLGGVGFVLIFVLALLLGIWCAWNEERLIDRLQDWNGDQLYSGILAVAGADSDLCSGTQSTSKQRSLYNRKREGSG